MSEADPARRSWVMALAYGVVSAPVIGQLVHVQRSDWYPTADDAVHAIHAHDVFSMHTPLVGMFSGISSGRPYVYHLGPMVFWALAIPERLFSERMGIQIAAAIVNIVAAVALLRSVRRVYNPTAALAIAGVVSITCWSVGRQTLAEAWNPYIGLIPLMLMLVYAFELANGSWKPLPWFALTASFVVQSHYIYLPVAAVSAVVGIGLGVVARRDAVDPDRRPADRRRAVIAAAAVTFVCWLPTLVDQVIHRPGNLRSWVAAFGHVRGYQLPASAAWRYVAHAIGWTPLVLRGPLPVRAIFQLQFDAAAVTNVVAWLVVAALVALTAFLWRRDSRAARLVAVAAAVVPVTALTVWRMPLTYPVIPVYRLVLLWPVSAFVWTAFVVGVGASLAQVHGVLRFFARLRGRVALAVVAGVTVVASVIAIAGAQSMEPSSQADSSATRAVIAQALGKLPHDARYRIGADGDLGYFVQYGLMRAMLNRGYHVFMPVDDVQLGRLYASDDPRDQRLEVSSQVGPVPQGARTIARFNESTPSQQAELTRAERAVANALRAEPLRLTRTGEAQRRAATGERRIALDAVANGTITADLLLDSELNLDVLVSSLAPNSPKAVFEVGRDIVPTLAAYGEAKRTVGSAQLRLLLMPSK